MTQARAFQRSESPSILVPDIRHFPIKRLFDLVFSSAVMLFGIPIFICIAAAIACGSTGPVIYSHVRIGRGGRTFPCYKFRTMFSDADERLEEILEADPRRRAEWQKSRKLKNDPRITWIGAFLRRTSLDELPQFWNVLRGDLSVVGPRAVVHDEVVQYMGGRAHKILSIRPGITGLWQVSGRSDTSYDQRLNLDEHYVDTRSLALDMKLIALTIPAMVSTRGAY